MLRLIAAGRLDRVNRARLLDALRAAIAAAEAAGRTAIELDVEQVTLADVGLVRTLLAARRFAVANGRSFRLLHPVGRLAMVLDVTGTRQMLCDSSPMSRKIGTNHAMSGAFEAPG
ncbi:STAS domain-containing protein [Dactylosporangium sp. CA-139066]|uniref:STAS domain-containing protein n=1 Tax=Dactylosporangium sp. CA-139066 TaxID=3239930 RepID=UPI003D90C344